MKLRTIAAIREDLEHARACLTDLANTSDWPDSLMAEQYSAQITRLDQELALATEAGLQVVLDGVGIYEHTVAVGRLTEFLDPLQRSLRHVAASAVREVGEKFGSTEKLLADAHLAHMFDGSVGLKIVGPPGPPTGEQLDMLRPTLFERTMSEIMDVLAASEESDVESALLERANNFNSDAVAALSALAKSMSTAGAPTRFAWRGTTQPAEKLVTLVPSQAQELHEILQSVQAVEEPLVVVGELAAVDSHDGSFHLVSDDGEFRGVVAVDLLHVAMDQEHRPGVVVSLVARTAVGRFRTSRPKYTLTGFPASTPKIE